MVGYVRTEEFNNNSLESGSIVVYHDGNILEICAVMHLNPEGSWVITGQTFDELIVPVSGALCKLVVLTDRGKYPLKFNQWDKAIRNSEVNSDNSVEFDLVPINKFKEGNLIKTCPPCGTQFMGNGRQKLCRDCSDAEVIAQIKVKKKSKPKRPRMMTPAEHKERCIAVAHAARKMHMMPAHEFNKWLEKQF